MTYYDELGVSPDATSDEIREAYKRLAKLLHPDTQQDDRVRHVAACQMQRLNLLYGTLSHAERRRVYDLTLQGPLLPMAPVAMPPLLAAWFLVRKRILDTPRLYLGMGGACLMVCLAWLVWPGGAETRPLPEPAAAESRSNSSRTFEESLRANAGRLDTLLAEVRHLRNDRDALIRERDRALGRVAELERAAVPVLPTPTAALPVPVLIAPTPATASTDSAQVTAVPSAVAATPERTAETGLAGTWYYTGNRRTASKPELYAAEYIEAVIEDDNGLLQGRYRARYRIPDRAISPEVTFSFEGKGGKESASFVWQGADGSQGEVRLRLLTANKVELAWVANSLGRSLGLGSGRAVLVRRLSP